MHEHRSPSKPELDQLLGSLVDNRMTPSEHRQLDTVLSDNLTARNQYYRYIDNHLALQRLHADPESLDRMNHNEGPVRSQGRRKRIHLGLAMIVACAVIVITLLSLSIFRPAASTMRSNSTPSETTGISTYTSLGKVRDFEADSVHTSQEDGIQRI